MSKVRHHSPLALARSYDPNIYRILGGKDKIKEIKASIFHTNQHIDNAIRILDKEYAYVNIALPYFSRFNIKSSGHYIVARMILPHIIRQGNFRHAGKETPKRILSGFFFLNYATAYFPSLFFLKYFGFWRFTRIVFGFT